MTLISKCSTALVANSARPSLFPNHCSPRRASYLFYTSAVYLNPISLLFVAGSSLLMLFSKVSGLLADEAFSLSTKLVLLFFLHPALAEG